MYTFILEKGNLFSCVGILFLTLPHMNWQATLWATSVSPFILSFHRDAEPALYLGLSPQVTHVNFRADRVSCFQNFNSNFTPSLRPPTQFTNIDSSGRATVEMNDKINPVLEPAVPLVTSDKSSRGPVASVYRPLLIYIILIACLSL